MKLYFQKLTPSAITPANAHAGDAGYDLCADLGIGNEVTLYPGSRLMVDTNIAVATPPNTYLRVAPRSGHAFKNGIDVLAGVIDETYRGGIGVILLNTGGSAFVIKHGMKIAQGIVELIAPIDEVLVVDKLPETTRGADGFGSTGH